MYQKCLDVLKKHQLVFVVAIFVGFIYGSHKYIVEEVTEKIKI